MAPGSMRGRRGSFVHTALAKQLPFIGLLVLAAVLSATIPTLQVTSWPALAFAFGFTAVATVLAVWATAQRLAGRSPRIRLDVMVPAIDFLAAGALRYATGESQSIWGSLVILPVAWLSAENGRRFIAYSTGGVFLSTVLPFAFGANLEENVNELYRGAFILLAFGFTSFVINELAKQARIRLRQVRAREAAATAEIGRASEVQQALFPKTRADVPGYETAGACWPSRQVGGDFYDWYSTDDGLAITLGDVMGKGLGAGMIATSMRTVVRSARNHQDPGIALRRTADYLAMDLGEAASFATAFHCRLRAGDGMVSYVDAGHGLSLVVRADGSWTRLASVDLPLGTALDDSWTSASFILELGDTLISFSDGVLDLYDGSLAAVDEVARMAVEAGDAQGLIERLRPLAEAGRHSDDITIVAVRRIPLDGSV